MIEPLLIHRVNSLIKDVSNPIDDQYYPAFRALDLFVGHSWSHGITPITDSKVEESTSEDYNFFFDIKLWAQVMGYSQMQDLATVILAIQKRSVSNYFLFEDDNTTQPSNFIKNKAAGIHFENKMDHTTWFSPRIECIQGIQMLPFTSITPYFRTSRFVAEEWQELLASAAPSITDGWKSILFANLAITDVKTSFATLANQTNMAMDDGLTKTSALTFAASFL